VATCFYFINQPCALFIVFDTLLAVATEPPVDLQIWNLIRPHPVT